MGKFDVDSYTPVTDAHFAAFYMTRRAAAIDAQLKELMKKVVIKNLTEVVGGELCAVTATGQSIPLKVPTWQEIAKAYERGER